MTLSALSSAQDLVNLFRELADDATTPYLWPDNLLLAYANEGQREAYRRARLGYDVDTAEVCVIDVTAGTSVYDVDPRVIYIRRAKLDSQDTTLRKAKLHELDQLLPGWESSAQQAPAAWLPWGTQQIKLVNTPDADDTLRLHVIREPLTVMDSDAVAQNAAKGSLVLGPLTVTSTFYGIISNNLAILIDGDTGPGNEDRDLQVEPLYGLVLHIILGTDAGGGYDDAKNSAHLVASLINGSVLSSLYYATYDSEDPVSPVGYTNLAGGSDVVLLSETPPEIAPRYRPRIVDWMLYRAFMTRDKQDKYNPAEAKERLALFEAEFGPPSSAADEEWINRKHGYDDYEGLF